MWFKFKCRMCGKEIEGNGFYLQVKFGKPYDQFGGKKHCGYPLIQVKADKLETLDRRRVVYRDPVTNELIKTNELVPIPSRKRREMENLTRKDIEDIMHVTKNRLRNRAGKAD